MSDTESQMRSSMDDVMPGDGDRLTSAMLEAGFEAIATSLGTMTRSQIEELLAEAQEALARVKRKGKVDELSPDYIAGRIAAAADILGHAAAATADESVLEMARTEPYASTLSAVADGKGLPSEISEATGTDVETTRATLAELCCASLVAGFRHGGPTHTYRLAPLGELIRDDISAS